MEVQGVNNGSKDIKTHIFELGPPYQKRQVLF